MNTFVIVATWLFVVTHLDTLVVLTAFCVDKAYRSREILVGHYLGFSVGLIAAVFGTLLAREFFAVWTPLLGLIPLGLGLWELFRRRPDETTSRPAADGPMGRITVVTTAGIGLSGENLAVFIPFFSGLSLSQLGLVTVLYLVGAAGVYLIAVALATWTASVGIPRWVDRWLVPVVLIVVGLYVLGAGLFVA